MNPKHVLIIPSLLYRTEYLALGGVFQHHQANCMKSAGYQVGVLSVGLLPFKCVLKSNPYAWPVINDEEGVAVIRYYQKAWIPQRYISPNYQANTVRKLGMKAFEEYIKQYGMPDVIHAHDCLYAGVLAQQIKKQYDIPIVITEHSSAHLRDIYTQAQSDMIKGVLDDADAITTVSSVVKAKLETKYKDAAPLGSCTLIYNLLEGAFEERELASTQPLAPDKGGFIFLHVANLVELKKQINLIKAMKQVVLSYPNTKLKIGGSGPMRRTIEKAIAELGLVGNVELLGYLDRGAVMQQMTLCNAFVLASDFETFGVVLIEAMSMGKPVIATRCGGPEDIVDDLCGILVSKDNVDELAGAMVKMIEGYETYQPELIREHCIDRFGSKAFLKRLKSIY